MRRLILCTAGHVDHGKTTLVHALTGIDCDTHPEEKRRGITINPGFAHLDLPSPHDRDSGGTSRLRLGIVDVPGHHRFIRNMLAGACGVDFALLVVAADDGVMPQTREHLALLGLLGIKDGLVCLTKIDLATPELLELAHEDVRQAVRGSCLAHAQTVAVSARSGVGLDETRAAIGRVVTRVVDRPCDGPFRMYVDRVFSVAGFGTVVTGSVTSGRIRLHDAVFALPGEARAKARRIERYGEEVSEAAAGERASLNLAGGERAELKPGMLIADRPLPVTRRLDGELTVASGGPRLGPHTRLLFYSGTQETSCRVRLLDRHPLEAGERVLAQLELERPAVLLPGDRFILRSPSRDVTVGGGSCIDPYPLHHRRRTATVVERLRRRASGGLPGAIASETEKRVLPATATEIADAVGCNEATLREAVSRAGREHGVFALEVAGQLHLWGPGTQERMVQAVHASLTQYHREHPLGGRGLLPADAAGRLGFAPAAASALAQTFLEELLRRGAVRRTEQGGFVLRRAEGHERSDLREAAALASRLFASAGMAVLSSAKLAFELGARFKLEGKDVKAILQHLLEAGEICAVDDGYVASAVVARCRVQLLRYLEGRPDGITVAQFRDLVHGNRRLCLDLLAVYDREGTTRRQGDLRIATPRGRAVMAGGNGPPRP